MLFLELVPRCRCLLRQQIINLFPWLQNAWIFGRGPEIIFLDLILRIAHCVGRNLQLEDLRVKSRDTECPWTCRLSPRLSGPPFQSRSGPLQGLPCGWLSHLCVVGSTRVFLGVMQGPGIGLGAAGTMASEAQGRPPLGWLRRLLLARRAALPTPLTVSFSHRARARAMLREP